MFNLLSEVSIISLQCISFILYYSIMAMFSIATLCFADNTQRQKSNVHKQFI